MEGHVPPESCNIRPFLMMTGKMMLMMIMRPIPKESFMGSYARLYYQVSFIRGCSPRESCYLSVAIPCGLGQILPCVREEN